MPLPSWYLDREKDAVMALTLHLADFLKIDSSQYSNVGAPEPKEPTRSTGALWVSKLPSSQYHKLTT